MHGGRPEVGGAMHFVADANDGVSWVGGEKWGRKVLERVPSRQNSRPVFIGYMIIRTEVSQLVRLVDDSGTSFIRV